MITFKQIEALFWIEKLGSFSAAANKLNTTQSAISKRILELENLFDIQIFDRSRRNSKLTEKGHELLILSKELLDKREIILERITTKEVLNKQISIGTTEFTAMSWLPKLIKEISHQYPKLTVIPQVELTSVLFERLLDDTLDLIIAPDIMDDARLLVHPLKAVENSWMCSPSYTNNNNVIPLERIGEFNVMAQANDSGTGLIIQRWLQQHKVKINNHLICSNVVAQLGFALSGQGITCLPTNAMQGFINKGQLTILHTSPGLPLIRYAIIHRADRTSRLFDEILSIGVKCCDFNSLFF